MDIYQLSLIKTKEMKVQSHTKVLSLMWRIENEHKAQEQYNRFRKSTQNCCAFQVDYVYPPHLGATPEGIVKCDCCGKVLILPVQSPPHNVKDSIFCPEHDNGQIYMKRTREYTVLSDTRTTSYICANEAL